MTQLKAEPELQCFQQICRYMEAHQEESLSLATLSHMAGLSPSHFQRRFKAIIGISPKQYLEACRLKTLKQELRTGKQVIEAIYEAGFSSGSRLYEKLDTRLGMTPKQYRNRGKGLSISYADARITLGPISLERVMIGATDRGLCFLQFGKTTEALLDVLQREYPEANISKMSETSKEQFDHWMQVLEDYLKGERLELELPLDIQGTAFQMKVWQYLQKIPYGQVQSYTEVAQGIGQPKAARAVASACAANNLAIVIPCHRVLRGTGALGGYRWGLDLKQALLDQEKHLRHT